MQVGLGVLFVTDIRSIVFLAVLLAWMYDSVSIFTPRFFHCFKSFLGSLVYKSLVVNGNIAHAFVSTNCIMAVLPEVQESIALYVHHATHTPRKESVS